MFKKIEIIASNFIKTSTIMEIFDVIGVPFIITVILYLFSSGKISDINDFASKFNDTTITITALLASFGLASLSILVTSSNENIERAKNEYTKRKDRRKKQVSYYKLQIIRNIFSLFVQFIVLFMSVLLKFVYEFKFAIKFFLYSELLLLIISIFLQVFVVISVYYLFVEPKKKSENI